MIRKYNVRLVTELGESLCQAIKRLFFAERSWFDSYREVANLFSELKKKAKIYFPTLDDEQFLTEINKWPDITLKQEINDLTTELSPENVNNF